MYIVILFAISLSLDAAAVGFSYGARKIKIPLLSALVVSAISMLLSFAAIYAGEYLKSVLPPATAQWIGIVMLFVLGSWMLFQGILSRHRDDDGEDGAENKETGAGDAEYSEKTILELMLKPLGISITIIKHAMDCDFDKSKRIEFAEALYLGFMLSMDAICSCIGLSMSGLGRWDTAVWIGVFQIIFLTGGGLIGKLAGQSRLFSARAASLLPGVILMAIALIKVFVA